MQIFVSTTIQKTLVITIPADFDPERCIKLLVDEMKKYKRFRNIIINLKDCDRITERMIQEFASLHCRLSKMKGRLVFICASDTHKQVFRTAGLDQVFDFYDTDRLAERAFVLQGQGPRIVRDFRRPFS